MTKDQRIYLRDLLERIERIAKITADGESTFYTSLLHQDAAIRNFEVIGEVVKKLDPKLTARIAEVPWSRYARFRDLLIHQYDKVLLDTVWRAANDDLEPLAEAARTLLKFLDTDLTHGER